MSKDVQASRKDTEIWADDRLNRAEMADKLTRYVCSRKNPFVISLNGAWGTGKTFFLERWQKDLKKQKIQSIYFNAWEDDFCDDPLVAIIGQLTRFSEGIERLRKHQKLLEDFASQLLKNAVSAVVGVPLPEADSALARYKEQEKIKEEFKSELESMARDASGEGEKPLVFIVDELDRCRPTFAIELLERVKHLLDVPGIVFVFGINRVELSKSVQSVYGNIDAGIYLHRFFDMEFSLLGTDLENFCADLVHKYELDQVFSRQQGFIPGLSIILKHLDIFSLRDAEHCIRAFAFVSSENSKFINSIIARYLLTVLILLRIKDSTLYKSFVQEKVAAIVIVEHFAEWRGDRGMQDDDVNLQFNLMELAIYATSRQTWSYLCGRTLERDRPSFDTPVPPGILFENTRNDLPKVHKLAEMAQKLQIAPSESHIWRDNPLARCATLLELVDVPRHIT